MKYKKWIINGLTIFLPLILGGITSIFIKTKEYKSFNKPVSSPPGIVFPIVWSILYLLIGISYFLVKRKSDRKDIKINYYLGLLVNFIWPFLFFNFKLYFVGFLWIILIIYLLIKLMIKYFTVDKKACYLQIPYLLWLCFALYLNVEVFILN